MRPVVQLLGSACKKPCTKWEDEDFTFEIIDGVLEITTYETLCFCFMQEVLEATKGVDVIFKLYRGRTKARQVQSNPTEVKVCVKPSPS